MGDHYYQGFLVDPAPGTAPLPAFPRLMSKLRRDMFTSSSSAFAVNRVRTMKLLRSRFLTTGMRSTLETCSGNIFSKSSKINYLFLLAILRYLIALILSYSSYFCSLDIRWVLTSKLALVCNYFFKGSLPLPLIARPCSFTECYDTIFLKNFSKRSTAIYRRSFRKSTTVYLGTVSSRVGFIRCHKSTFCVSSE